MAPQIIWLSGCFNVATTNLFVKMLTQWLHVVRYKWLHGSFIKKKSVSTQQESNGDDVWQNPVYFSSSMVSGVAFVLACWTLVQILCSDISKRIAVLFTCKIAQIFLQES